jgi:hypothetical protein
MSILLVGLFFALISATCQDCANCAKCISTERSTGGYKTVVISTSDCKADSISWLCCKSSQGGDSDDCVLQDCNGVTDLVKNKCEEVTHLTYSVPDNTRTINIQLHDGQFIGNKDCSDGDCCGGSGGSCGSTGVCETTIDLTTCPEPIDVSFIRQCTRDEHCDNLNFDCSQGKCINYECRVVFLPNTVCRLSNGVCDEEERCINHYPFCPPDFKKGSSTVCRSAVIAADGTTCDEEEYCTGTSNDCQDDTFLPDTSVCRPGIDMCDIPETCTGSSPICPPDLRNDLGYTYKCSTTQFLCGVGPGNLTINSGNGYLFGSCGIGTARTFTILDWPNCLTQCMQAICPNGRGLSNYAEGHCVPSTGSWYCDIKIDVTSSTPLPHCPYTNE